MKPITKARVPGYEPGVELMAELRPYVRHCGATVRPAWRIGERKLLDYLLVYIAEGRGEFIVADERYDVGKNDLFWIPPDTVHVMEGYPPEMLCPYVHFDLIYRPEISHWDFSIPHGMVDLGELRVLMHPDMSHTQFGKLSGRLRTHTNRRIGGLITELVDEAYRAHPYSGLYTSGLLMEILALILRGLQGLAEEREAYVPMLEKAAVFLRTHCGESISVDDAAAEAGLCPSYFRKLFGIHFGCSPRTYLRNARIWKAKQLMVSSAATLSEIAERCGFATVHSFSRAFKTTEGMSPSNYRWCGEPGVHVEGRQTPYSR